MQIKSLCNQIPGLQNDQVTAAEWEKSAIQELDITATDLSAECIIDVLTRVPNIRWLSAGQLDAFSDNVGATNSSYYIIIKRNYV